MMKQNKKQIKFRMSNVKTKKPKEEGRSKEGRKRSRVAS
jgi:hypothetical protein